MSELSASQCGCNNSCECGGNNGGNSCLWIIILLFLCGGCGGNSCGFSSCGSGNDCGNSNGCESIIWILLLFCLCGNNSFC